VVRAVAGGAAAVAVSPIGQKLRSKLGGGGTQAQAEPQSITLPVQPPPVASPAAETPPPTATEGTTSGAAATTAQPTEGNGVLAGRPVPPQSGSEEGATGA